MKPWLKYVLIALGGAVLGAGALMAYIVSIARAW